MYYSKYIFARWLFKVNIWMLDKFSFRVKWIISFTIYIFILFFFLFILAFSFSVPEYFLIHKIILFLLQLLLLFLHLIQSIRTGLYWILRMEWALCLYIIMRDIHMCMRNITHIRISINEGEIRQEKINMQTRAEWETCVMQFHLLKYIV